MAVKVFLSQYLNFLIFLIVRSKNYVALASCRAFVMTIYDYVRLFVTMHNYVWLFNTFYDYV